MQPIHWRQKRNGKQKRQKISLYFEIEFAIDKKKHYYSLFPTFLIPVLSVAQLDHQAFLQRAVQNKTLHEMRDRLMFEIF